MNGLKGIMISEVSWTRERKISYDFAFMWNLKNKTNKQTKQKQTQTQETNWWLPAGKGLGGAGEIGERN